MRATVYHGPRDVRVEDVPDAALQERTDALVRVTHACICGSDLWPYRGAEPVDHQVMGHEYVGVVEQIGEEVGTVGVGDFVVGSFWASDNACEICRTGYPASCVNRVLMGTLGTQSELARIPLADGTLVAIPGMPDPDLVPSLLAASDVVEERGSAGVAAVKELSGGLGAHSVIEAVGSRKP
jgi:threonine dehydrogenase-like Zn-dependent dehydrogenase